MIVCSQETIHLSTSFDDVRVDQRQKRIVSASPTDVSLFDAYKDRKKGNIYINYETFDTIAAIAQVEQSPEQASCVCL